MPGTHFTVWGGVTDPACHDPESYRYLVHIDSGFIDYEQKRKRYFIDDLTEIDIPLGTGHRTSRNRQPVISASLISHEVNPLFVSGSHGLILEAPDDAIIATSATDIWIDDESLDRLSRLSPHEANQLLEQTSPITNNEVVLDPRLLVVTGIIFLASPRYSYHLRSHSPSQIHDVAEKNSLPFISI